MSIAGAAAITLILAGTIDNTRHKPALEASSGSASAQNSQGGSVEKPRPPTKMMRRERTKPQVQIQEKPKEWGKLMRRESQVHAGAAAGSDNDSVKVKSNKSNFVLVVICIIGLAAWALYAADLVKSLLAAFNVDPKFK